MLLELQESAPPPFADNFTAYYITNMEFFALFIFSATLRNIVFFLLATQCSTFGTLNADLELITDMPGAENL